ncbi:MAG TPA: hypothetical protein DCS63_01700 [Elusimicrobia bacterium]|nr:hypothetical protein [Elusimicrobiota bacterium]
MISLVLLAGLLLCQPVYLAALDKTIYGSDGRLDFFQVTDPVQRRVMDSAVSLFKSPPSLVCDGEYCRFGGWILGTEARRMCPGERFFTQKTAAFCSGTLIAPDLVLTAGHCMEAAGEEAGRCFLTKFIFGHSIAVDGDQPGLIRVSEIYSCKGKVLFAFGEGRDYAVLRLDRPVTGHKPAQVDFSPARAGTEIFTIGGPYGLPLKVLGGGVIRSVDAARGVMYTNLDSSGGNSGGGVFSAVTGKVVGLHVASADPDLVEVPLPANHGLPATDRRVIEGKCKTAAAFSAGGGYGKKAVLVPAVQGLQALLGGGASVGADTGLKNFDFSADPELVLEMEANLR